MMVLAKQDYTNKTQNLLAQRDTHRPITADPPNKDINLGLSGHKEA